MISTKANVISVILHKNVGMNIWQTSRLFTHYPIPDFSLYAATSNKMGSLSSSNKSPLLYVVLKVSVIFHNVTKATSHFLLYAGLQNIWQYPNFIQRR